MIFLVKKCLWFKDDFVVVDVSVDLKGLCRDQENNYGGGSRAPPVGFDNSMPIIKERH